jgi:DNA end-binding protein Ku
MKQQNVDAETGEVVSRDNMVRGYEVAKGQYMIVEDEEIEAVQIESTRTIDIDRFVPKNEIDERYIDSPYYIGPDGAVGQEAFAVIRDTIAKLNMVALGRVGPFCWNAVRPRALPYRPLPPLALDSWGPTNPAARCV